MNFVEREKSSLIIQMGQIPRISRYSSRSYQIGNYSIHYAQVWRPPAILSHTAITHVVLVSGSL